MDYDKISYRVTVEDDQLETWCITEREAVQLAEDIDGAAFRVYLIGTGGEGNAERIVREERC